MLFAVLLAVGLVGAAPPPHAAYAAAVVASDPSVRPTSASTSFTYSLTSSSTTIVKAHYVRVRRSDGTAGSYDTTRQYTSTVVGTRSFTAFRAVPVGAWTAQVRFTVDGRTWSSGPRVTFTVLPAVTVRSVLEFGAVGDGVADDTVAVQRALDSVRSGEVLQFPAGRVFRHTDVLVVRVPGVRVTGPGTLLATNETRSAVFVNADGVRLDGGLVLRMALTTQRYHAYEQMKLRIGRRAGVSVQDVLVDGSAAAGVYVGGASGFSLVDLSVRNTRADGIHMTEGSRDGVVTRPTITNSGDDGVAVVSYAADTAPVQNIRVQSPRVLGTAWGRGLSVVGGSDISYSDIAVERSSGAAVYVGAEGAPYYTYPAVRVTVDRGTISGANTASGVDHGAVLLHNGQPATVNSDITLQNLRITGTRSTASWQLGVISDGGAPQRRVTLSGISITGGGNAFTANVPTSSYNLRGLTVNGVARPDSIGWTG